MSHLDLLRHHNHHTGKPHQVRLKTENKPLHPSAANVGTGQQQSLDQIDQIFERKLDVRFEGSLGERRRECKAQGLL